MSVGSAGCRLAAETVMLAEAVFPVPPSVEVTALVTLFCVPAAVPVTFTAKLQDALAANVALARLTLVDPAVAAIVPPPQLPVNALGVDTSKPAGKVSVKAMPLRDEAILGLPRLNVSVVVALSGTLAAPKDLAIVGGTTGGGGGEEEPPPHAKAHGK